MARQYKRKGAKSTLIHRKGALVFLEHVTAKGRIPLWSYVMRNRTPLAPAELSFDVTVYLVLNDFGPLGRAYVETDESEADEATIVENILSGHYSHPLRVVAFNAAEGWARDVTEDVARTALNTTQSERRQIAEVAQEFLERTLGARVT